MVNFSKTDFQIVMAMVIFVVIISFLFPPMGFTSQNINSTDIPQFNMSQNTFDFVGEAPEMPTSGDSGQLTYVEGAAPNEDNRDQWIETNEIGISMFNMQTSSDPLPRVQLTNHTDMGSLQDWEYMNESEFVTISNWSYEISFDNMQYTDDNQTITVDWEIHERPSDSTFLGSIPFVGGLADVAGVLVWIGELLFHYIITIFSGIANMGIALTNLIVFIFTFLYWILSMYGNVATAAPTAWAAVIMAIPGVVLSFEFVKLLIILIRTASGLIPTT